jgi:hypothetical protein
MKLISSFPLPSLVASDCDGLGHLGTRQLAGGFPQVLFLDANTTNANFNTKLHVCNISQRHFPKFMLESYLSDDSSIRS